MLKGVTTATAISDKDGEYTNFIFTKVDDEIGFYPAKAGTIPAYKAYLQIPTASLPASALARLYVVFEDGETTSITPVRNNQKTSDEWYTLGGQRSTKPTERGIYIHEGKKVIIK
jgi:alpha-amylase